MTTPGDRLHTLDALRGIAALFVVASHVAGPSTGLIPSGHLAVDFFFVLSGLVIARTFEARLASSMSFSDFCRTRLVRLYPLFFLGLFLDVGRVALFAVGGKLSVDPTDVMLAFLREMLFLPSDQRLDLLFFLNPPAWSLFQELLVNLLFAAVLFRLARSALIFVAISALAVFAIASIQAGTFDLGSSWSTIYVGFARACFGFVVGIMIARARLRAPRQSKHAIVPAVLLITLMWAPQRLLIQGLCIVLLIPAIVVIGASFEPPSFLKTAFALLGEASYPMYALHWALIWPLMSTTRAIGLPRPFAIFLVIAIVFAVGIGASRIYEKRARELLRRLILDRPVMQAGKA